MREALQNKNPYLKKIYGELVLNLLFQGTDSDIDSYSAFFDNGGNGDTGLQAIIKDFVTEVNTVNKYLDP